MKTLKEIINWILGKKEEPKVIVDTPVEETAIESVKTPEVTPIISAPTITEHSFDFKEVDTTKKTAKKTTKKVAKKPAKKKTTPKKKK